MTDTCPDCGRLYCDNDRTVPMQGRCNKLLPIVGSITERECLRFALAKNMARIAELEAERAHLERGCELLCELYDAQLVLTAGHQITRNSADEKWLEAERARKASFE